MLKGIIAVCLLALVPGYAYAKCKIKYDDDGVAGSRYFSVSTWSAGTAGAAFRFSKYGDDDYLFDVRYNKGFFPWNQAEFSAESWVRIQFAVDELIMRPVDVKKSVRRTVISMPWDRITESRYSISGESVAQISAQDVTTIEISAIGPNGEEHSTPFKMKPKWIKKLRERAACIIGAEPKTTELP